MTACTKYNVPDSIYSQDVLLTDGAVPAAKQIAAPFARTIPPMPAVTQLSLLSSETAVAWFMNVRNVNIPIIRIFRRRIPLHSLMNHSLTSPSSVANVMYQKYVNSIPLYRQEKDWEQLGISSVKGNHG